LHRGRRSVLRKRRRQKRKRRKWNECEEKAARGLAAQKRQQGKLRIA
jgi:hypothetical protein